MNPLTLNLSVLVLRGHQVGRRRYVIDELDPSSDVASVKRRVEDWMACRPDEMELMIGDRTLADSEILSECDVQSGTELRVLAQFLELASESLHFAEQDETETFPSEALSSSPSTRYSSQGDEWVESQLFHREWLPDPCPDEKQPPPPVLTRPARRRVPAPRCGLLSFGRQDAAVEAKAFDLQVKAKIILGLHVHVRASVVCVTLDTKVSDIEEHIRQWLGSDPDELVLMVGTVTLDSHNELCKYNLGETPILQAIAWYEHSRDV